MARTLYCWRCRADVPMLEEHEWAQVELLLRERLKRIKEYREAHGAPLKDAIEAVDDTSALELYRRLTGFQESDISVLRHHRLGLFGPPCRACGKPLRTPRARLCAECGATVANR